MTLSSLSSDDCREEYAAFTVHKLKKSTFTLGLWSKRNKAASTVVSVFFFLVSQSLFSPPFSIKVAAVSDLFAWGVRVLQFSHYFFPVFFFEFKRELYCI